MSSRSIQRNCCYAISGFPKLGWCSSCRSIVSASFGADAVLFVTISDWSTRYIVVQSSTVVTVSFLLKDTRTGTTLWEGTQSVARNSGDAGNPIATLIVAAVTYAVNQMVEIDYRPLAMTANAQAFGTPGVGLPAGPYHPDFGKDQCQYSP